ncbi:MAG TPA: 50S ribosomal protein L21 [Chloroflexia bacterium]|nr:50S ribosomal protein L21 [Chloroflexia bacterium]
MYAIIKTGGHQYRVAPGDTLEVEKLDAAPGTNIELGEVLMVSGDDGVTVGNPLVSGAKVLARVVSQGKGEKLIIFKFKAKKRYRRKTGHRQSLTRIAITDISL